MKINCYIAQIPCGEYDKMRQWQGGGFEPGTSWLKVQRPTTRPPSPPHKAKRQIDYRDKCLFAVTSHSALPNPWSVLRHKRHFWIGWSITLKCIVFLLFWFYSFSFCISFLQLTDVLLYTTPVGGNQYKLNKMLPLLGMQVSGLWFTTAVSITDLFIKCISLVSEAGDLDKWLWEWQFYSSPYSMLVDRF